jgi:hypothetical protein
MSWQWRFGMRFFQKINLMTVCMFYYTIFSEKLNLMTLCSIIEYIDWEYGWQRVGLDASFILSKSVFEIITRIWTQIQRLFGGKIKLIPTPVWFRFFHPNRNPQQEHAKIQQQHSLVTCIGKIFKKIHQKKLNNIKYKKLH